VAAKILFAKDTCRHTQRPGGLKITTEILKIIFPPDIK